MRRLGGVGVREVVGRRRRRPRAQPIRGTRPSRSRTARPGTSPSPSTPPSSSVSSSASWRPRQIPRIGAPAAEARRERLVVAARAQPVHRRAGRADAGQHREIGGGDVVADVAPSRANASPTQRTLPAPYSQIATFTARPSSTACPRRLDTHCRPQRATDRLEGGLGDVVRVAAGRLDVDRRARRPARGSRSMCVAMPGIVLERELACGRPPRSTAARASASSIGTTASP